MQASHGLTDLLKNESTRREAFSALVKEYQQRIYSIVRKMVISHDDADDIVQEVFVKVWHNIASFKGDSALFTWVYRIAVNESLMFLRKRRKQQWFGSDITEELENALVSEKHIEADEIQQKLQKAILRLPDKQRLVFNLKYFEDLSYEEIAEITESSVGSLKASFHPATKKIEDFFQED